MRKMLAVSLVAATLGSCAVQPPAPNYAGAPSRCISLNQVIARRPVAPAAIEFEMLRGRTLRNQLATVCPGIERLGDLGVIAITSGGEGGRLCRGDRVRIFDPIEARATGIQSYPECVLGDFVELPRR